MGKKQYGGQRDRNRNAGVHGRHTQNGASPYPLETQLLLHTIGVLCSAAAIETFDGDVDTVRRVELKINPHVFGQFLVMAIMQSDVRYEGIFNHSQRQVEWCVTPNCTCMRFLVTRSPLEAGFSIDD